MQDFWLNLQLLFGAKYAKCKLFRLNEYQTPKYGMESQGMDVFDDRYIFQGSDNTGKLPSLVVVDLKTKKIVSEYQLPKLKGCHMNNINIGSDQLSNSKYPILYISECRNKRRCYVVNPLSDTVCDLMQEIYFDSKKHYGGGGKYPFDWFVDDSSQIYTFGMTGVDGEMEICKFKLPSLDYLKRTFTDDDVIESFKIQNIYTYQGTKIIDGKLYAFSGLDTKECPTYLHVINLKTHKIEEKININGLGELEALGKYKNGFIAVNCAYNPTYNYIRIN